MNQMLESKVQARLIKRLESEGFYVIKLITTNKNGIPDLLVLKGDYYKFIEVKAKDGELSKLQKYRINELKDHNIRTEVFYGE